MPCSSRIISEMLHVPKIHTMEMCDFRKSLFYSQIISFSVSREFHNIASLKLLSAASL